jgi:hypothetical protein
MATITRRHFLGFGTVAALGAAVGCNRKEELPKARQQEAQPQEKIPYEQQVQSELSQLSDAISGRDFRLIRWYGAIPGDVTDHWHAAVINREPQEFIQAFLFENRAIDRSPLRYNFEGEAREAKGIEYLVKLPSDTIGTRIPNIARSQGMALVDYAERSVVKVNTLRDLATVAAIPLDPMNAEYWMTSRAKQPKPDENFKEYRWITPGLEQRILAVETRNDGNVSIFYNTDLALKWRGGSGTISRDSPLGPYIIKRFAPSELERSDFGEELQRGGWREARTFVLDSQSRTRGFRLENNLIGREGNGWIPLEQKYDGLVLRREANKLRIAEYHVGG